jgi:branched-chain amino acid aminotransferase
MVTARWNRTEGWHGATVEPYRPIELDPAAMVLHYGQAIFEGLKAYRHLDGSIQAFRPEENAARFRRSANRLAMPEMPDDLFLGSLRELLAVDGRWVPTEDEESLYLRPYMISTEVGLGVRPSAEYLYLVIASPAGSYFASGIQPVSVWLSHEYVRAAPGGTGAAKFAGNYAASLVAQAQAAEQGCDQVVWLDAVERRWVEEMGGMNLFFVFGSGEDARVVTPELSGSLLPGVTRNSILTLATEMGYAVEERRISTEEWEKKVESGELTEVFACGTAAVITPVGSVKHAEGSFTINGGRSGEVSMRLRNALTAIQRGTAPDTHGWLTKLC